MVYGGPEQGGGGGGAGGGFRGGRERCRRVRCGGCPGGEAAHARAEGGASFAPPAALLVVHPRVPRGGWRARGRHIFDQIREGRSAGAADPKTGATRVVVTEKQETWQRNRPLMRFLEDGRRFIWETEKSGWKQYELRNLDGALLNPLTGTSVTASGFPAEAIVKVDEGKRYGGHKILSYHSHMV